MIRNVRQGQRQREGDLGKRGKSRKVKKDKEQWKKRDEER